MPNPPGANPLVAERAPCRSSQSRVTGGQQPIGNPYIQIPVISSAHLAGHPVRRVYIYVVFSMPNMTGRPGHQTMEMIGGSSAPYLARTPCVPLFCTLFNSGGNRGALDYQGRAGDHFHCTVEPSPGHIRCRVIFFSEFFGLVYPKLLPPPPSPEKNSPPEFTPKIVGIPLQFHFCRNFFFVLRRFSARVRHAVKEGLGRDFYREGNSVKR